MLTGRYEAIPGEGQNVTPSTWNSMADSFKQSFNTINLVMPQSASDRTDLLDSVNAMQMAANSGDQGMGQKTANWFAGFAGSALHPAALATGEVLGAVAGKALSGSAGLIGRYLPVEAAVVGTAIAQKRLGTFLGESAPGFVANSTVGGIAKGAVSGFAIGTGFSLPEEVAKTYNPTDNSFNWWGGVKASFADGGIGLGLMAVPFLAGTIWGKMFRKAGQEVSHAEMPLAGDARVGEGELPNHPSLGKIDEAEAKGLIQPHEAQWFRDYATGNLSNDELVNRAVQLLIRDGHPVDAATKRVLFQIMKPEDVDRLQMALSDGMASNVPEELKPLLQKYMTDANADTIRGKGNMLDGIQGVTNFLKAKLGVAPEERINLNKVLRKLLPENLKEENPFTQSKIYKAAKAKKMIGVRHPEHVEKLLAHEAKVKELKNKISNYEKAFADTNKNKFQNLKEKAMQRLSDLEAKKPSLLSHADEIKHLRDQLIKNGQVKSNFKYTKAYERLHDLTRVRNDARRLMHEVHLAYEHQMHEHYATFLDSMTKLMRASVGQLADHDNVINYMKERLVRRVPELQKMERIEAREATKVDRHAEVKAGEASEKVEGEKSKTFQDDFVKSFDEDMKNAKTEPREDYEKTRNQFEEFNQNQGVLKNLIKCVQGSLNV